MSGWYEFDSQSACNWGFTSQYRTRYTRYTHEFIFYYVPATYLLPLLWAARVQVLARSSQLSRGGISYSMPTCQEGFSVLFSLLNMIPHIYFLWFMRPKVSSRYPLKRLYTVYAAVHVNAVRNLCTHEIIAVFVSSTFFRDALSSSPYLFLFCSSFVSSFFSSSSHPTPTPHPSLSFPSPLSLPLSFF